MEILLRKCPSRKTRGGLKREAQEIVSQIGATEAQASSNGRKEPKRRSRSPAPLAPLEILEAGYHSTEEAANRKLIALNTVKVESVRWLVPDLIPLGSVTVLYGPKAEGKSTVSYNLAAHITSGKPMPFCDGHSISGGAILLQAEDDLGLVRKSIEAAGGVPERIRVFSKRDSLYLDDPEDLRLIQDEAEEIEAKLLVADPFTEFFRKSLKDEKVIRESFRLLRALAASLKMAVVLVGHFTKTGSNSLYRGLGGVAIINPARAALVVGRDPSSDDPYRHVLAFNRGNLPRTRDVSLVYRTVKRGDAIVIEWLGESKYSADDLIAASRNADAHSQLQEACYVLYAILATHGGPLPATEVYKAAQDALVSVGTLKRAKKLLKVRSRRRSFDILVPVEQDEEDEAQDDSKEMQLQTVIRWVWEQPDDEELLRPYKERFERERAEDETEHREKTADRHQRPGDAREDEGKEKGDGSHPSVLGIETARSCYSSFDGLIRCGTGTTGMRRP